MGEWWIVSGRQRDTLGEGVLWSARDRAIYWVDILAPAVNRLCLADGSVERWPMPEPIGWLVERRRGGFIAGFQSGFAELSLDPLSIAFIGDPEPDLPGNRMNDGKADDTGAIWCGTMDMAEKAASGSLYRLDPDLGWHRMDTGYGVPNGPAFSADGRYLYHADTARRTIRRFCRTSDGGITDGEPFILFGERDGYPDGMTVDADGCLWVAHWGGGRIGRYDPHGRLDRFITLPVSQPTNVTFAGERLDRLFVTSAAIGQTGTLDGALFELACEFHGLATPLFAG